MRTNTDVRIAKALSELFQLFNCLNGKNNLLARYNDTALFALVIDFEAISGDLKKHILIQENILQMHYIFVYIYRKYNSSRSMIIRAFAATRICSCGS